MRAREIVLAFEDLALSPRTRAPRINDRCRVCKISRFVIGVFRFLVIEEGDGETRVAAGSGGRAKNPLSSPPGERRSRDRA